MNKYWAKTIVGAVGMAAIGIACYVTSSGLPLLGMVLLIWLLHDGFF